MHAICWTPWEPSRYAGCDHYGDHDGDGYIEYQRKTLGLGNHCWKDSWNSILFYDGTLARTPRATCESQGHAYDARSLRPPGSRHLEGRGAGSEAGNSAQ